MPLELDPPFDPAVYLTDTDSQAELINDALASGDPGYIANALGVVARARGMGGVAHATGINRQTLYRSLSLSGNPTIDTVSKVLNTLGFQLGVKPAAAPGVPTGHAA